MADGRLRLCLGDGTTLPLADGSVDAVVAVHTIYFWPDPQATLAECARVLGPDGRLVLAPRDGAQESPSRLDPTIYPIPTIRQLEDWMTDAGFEVAAGQTLGEVVVVHARGVRS